MSRLLPNHHSAESLARAALIAVAVLVVVAGGFVWRLERDVRASAERIDESQRQARLAADAASRQVAERQQQAARELAAAQELAARAQMIGDVLAAPDLVRYSLVGRDALCLRFRSGAVEPVARVRVQRVRIATAAAGCHVPNLAAHQDGRCQRGDLCPRLERTRHAGGHAEGSTIAARRHRDDGASRRRRHPVR